MHERPADQVAGEDEEDPDAESPRNLQRAGEVPVGGQASWVAGEDDAVARRVESGAAGVDAHDRHGREPAQWIACDEPLHDDLRSEPVTHSPSRNRRRPPPDPVGYIQLRTAAA